MIFLRFLLTQAVLGSRKDDSENMTHGMNHNHISNDIVNHIADGIANGIADEMISGTLHGNNPERKEVAVQKLLEADIAIGHDFHLNCDQKDLQGESYIMSDRSKIRGTQPGMTHWTETDDANNPFSRLLIS